VVAMEDSCLFDVGINYTYLTIGNKIEMDAAIMNGKDLSTMAVVMDQNIRNPISLARRVMEKTDHVMLAGEGALELAKVFNINTCKVEPTEKNLLNYNRFLENVKSNKENPKEEYARNYKY
jgi:isoaspartyl peptidase/L-asparaginase-like protein (Ntn-hydrolase superfamily)